MPESPRCRSGVPERLDFEADGGGAGCARDVQRGAHLRDCGRDGVLDGGRVHSHGTAVNLGALRSTTVSPMCVTVQCAWWPG